MNRSEFPSGRPATPSELPSSLPRLSFFPPHGSGERTLFKPTCRIVCAAASRSSEHAMSITTLISPSRLGENRVLVWSAACEELGEQNGKKKEKKWSIRKSKKKEEEKNHSAANKLPDHQLARALTCAFCLRGGGVGERLRVYPSPECQMCCNGCLKRLPAWSHRSLKGGGHVRQRSEILIRHRGRPEPRVFISSFN